MFFHRKAARIHHDITCLDKPSFFQDSLLILKDGSHCVLSRTYRAAFMELWGMGG